jgi:hypothetical protein
MLPESCRGFKAGLSSIGELLRDTLRLATLREPLPSLRSHQHKLNEHTLKGAAHSLERIIGNFALTSDTSTADNETITPPTIV